MNAQTAGILSAVRRTQFHAFLMKVFEQLHPGEKPLRLAWYVRAICHALDEVRVGRKRRLVITVPPRHLKSITAAVAFVAWLLGHDPTLKIMVASYSQDLARHHSNLTRAVMESEWYRADFPGTRISDRGNRALELETTAGGVRKAVSVGGSITGFGADIIIVDDCMKADEARSQAVRDEVRGWFDNSVLTRLNDKASGIILSIQQRLHEDDLPAYMLAKGYEDLKLPAIAEKEERVQIGPNQWHERKVGDLLNPERENREVLDQLRRDLGPAVFAAQYQQDPVAPEGNLIRMEWFGTYHEVPERHMFLKVVCSWDTGMSEAPTANYSASTVWGFHRDEHKWYLLEVYRDKLGFPALKRAVIRLQRSWKADAVIIEDASSGKSLSQEFKASGPFLPVMIAPVADKEERFVGTFAEIEAGNLLLPAEAPWLDAFRSELKAFPQATNDDQVDSFSQFVAYQRRKWRWMLTDYEPDGRPTRRIRHRRRPW
jgi:predicted phage terminase large subunit-like protein